MKPSFQEFRCLQFKKLKTNNQRLFLKYTTPFFITLNFIMTMLIILSEKITKHTSQVLKLSFIILLAIFLLPGISQAEVTYKVTTKTGWKGTDADIMILLVGTKGAWEDFKLLDSPKNDFWPEAVDHFVFYTQEDIGIITDVIIEPRGAGINVDNWKMEYMKVENTIYPGKITTFYSTPLFSGDTKYPFQMRAQEFKNPNITTELVDIPIGAGEVIGFINFGKTSADGVTVNAKASTTSGYVLEKTDNVSTMNSWSISAETQGGDGVIIPKFSVTATYAGNIATSFTTKTNEQENRYNENGKTKTFSGEPCMATFHLYRPMEKRVVATIRDKWGGKEKFVRVMGGFIPDSYQTYTFRAVDDKANGDCANCPTFAELFKLAGLTGTVPDGPTLASLKTQQIGGCNVDLSDVPDPPKVDNGVPPKDIVYDPPKDDGYHPPKDDGYNPPFDHTDTTTPKGEFAISELAFCDHSGNVVGYFVRNTDNNWIETDQNRNPRFHYQETKWEGDVIYLSDKHRTGVQIMLDLNNDDILYSDKNNTTPFRINSMCH